MRQVLDCAGLTALSMKREVTSCFRVHERHGMCVRTTKAAEHCRSPKPAGCSVTRLVLKIGFTHVIRPIGSIQNTFDNPSVRSANESYHLSVSRGDVPLLALP